MRNKKARKNEQLFIYFVAFLHSINKNQVAFISALEEPRIPARFPKVTASNLDDKSLRISLFLAAYTDLPTVSLYDPLCDRKSQPCATA